MAYNEETVMAELDMENEVGSIFSYNENWDQMSESQYSQRPSGRYYSNGGGAGYKGNGRRNYYQKRNSTELIGDDHYRTVLKSKGKSPIFVEYYITKYYPGIIIRDAVTGNYEKAKVGRLDEDLYFKVKISNGNDSDGHLYYNSPEEYERHWHTSLPLAIKQTWLEKYTVEFERRNPRDTEMTMHDYILSHDPQMGEVTVVK
jgi:hypothetical protein